MLASVDFPHSLGLLYSALTAFLGFRVNEGEYKVMGLAPYGEPRFLDELRTLVRHPAGELFALDLRYFAHDRSVEKGWSPALEALLGPPVSPQRPLRRGGDGFQRAANVAASLQRLLEEELLRLVERARELTGERVLCYGGGVALNCVANGKLARSGVFERLLVHPAAGDAGGALGCALAWAASHAPLPTSSFTPFLGPAVRPPEPGAEDWIRCDDEDAFVERTAALLADGAIVGWMHGHAEWGPRALGARSILARPDLPGLQERLNRMIKHREGFRPFAPVVLAEHAELLFDELSPGFELERYMLGTARTRPEWRARLEAVTHVDGSARVQVLRPEDAPLFHRLLAAFHARTGIPAAGQHVLQRRR